MASSQAYGRSLQEQAIINARLAFSNLPGENAAFQQCLDHKDSIADIVKLVADRHRSYRDRRSTRILERFQQYTAWLQNCSATIDVVVQTQAGIGCPLWAPVKFLLQVSKDYADAAEQILTLIQTISENLPRFDIYEKLQSDHIVSAALLNIFSDVVEFSVMAFQYFGRGALARMCRQFGRPFKEEFGNILQRLTRHARVADHTAVAAELLKAAEFRQSAVLQNRENVKIQIQNWLRPSNMRAFHQSQLEAKLSGTCRWIWGNRGFNDWVASASPSVSDRLFCLSGTHGCGKTVLASSIVEVLRETHNKTIYFSFSGTDVSRRDFDCLARSLLWQASESIDTKQSIDIVKSLMAQGPPVKSELWDAFQAIAVTASDSVYYVIDGTDECADPVMTWFDRIIGLLTLQKKAKVAIFGRPHSLRSAIGSSARSLEMSPDLTKQDINDYILSGLKDHNVLDLPELRTTVLNTLQEKSEGMFLFPKLVIDHLRKSESVAQARERINDLPFGLEEAYRLILLQLLERLDTYEIRLLRHLLTFTMTSLRLLSVEELRHMHALVSGPSDSYEDCLLIEPSRKLNEVGGGLINIRDGFVRLVHVSIKEFLMRPEHAWLGENDRKILTFRVDLQLTHRTLGSACTKYLALGKYDLQLQDPDLFLSLDGQYPFLRYASQFHLSHLSRSGPPCTKTLEKLWHFMESDKYTSWMEYATMVILGDDSNDVLHEFDTFMNWLHQANAGLDSLFEKKYKTVMKQELAKRVQQLGKEDPRTEHPHAFELLFADDDLDILDTKTNSTLDGGDGSLVKSGNADNDAQCLMPASEMTIRQSSAAIRQVQTMLQSDWNLSLPKQVEIVLTLASRMQKMRGLVDPLKFLYQMLLRKAAAMPAYMLLFFGWFYCNLGKFEESVQVNLLALKKVEHREALVKYLIMFQLSNAYLDQGNGAEAESICRRSLDQMEKSGRKEDSLLANTTYNLGSALWQQEKLEDAERMYRRTADLEGRQRGKHHKSTLETCHYLAEVLVDRYKDAEAEDLLRKTLVGRQQTLGEDHQGTVRTLGQLGLVLSYQEKWEESERVYREVVVREKRDKKKSRFDKAGTLAELGLVLYYQKKYEESETMFREAILQKPKDLKIKSRWAESAYTDLAKVLAKQEKYEEAEKVYRQAISEQENDNSTSLAARSITISKLALVLCNLLKFEESEEVGLQAINLQSKEPQKLCETTLDNLEDLVSMLIKNDRHVLAESLCRRALAASNAAFGIHDEATLRLVYYLGITLYFQEYDSEAEDLFRQALSAQEDPESNIAIEISCYLAWLFLYQSKNKEAFTFYRRALAGFRKCYGSEHDAVSGYSTKFSCALHGELHINSKLFDVDEGGSVGRLSRRHSDMFVVQDEGWAWSPDTEHPRSRSQSMGEETLQTS